MVMKSVDEPISRFVLVLHLFVHAMPQMNPQKLINYVALCLFLMNVLLMYMIVDIFRAEYGVFEDRLANQPGDFNLVFERLLRFSRESLMNFPTMENGFLNDMLENMHPKRTTV